MAAAVPPANPIKQSASTVRAEPDVLAGLVAEIDLGELASPARKAPAPAPTAAEARAPRPPREGGRSEAAAPKEADPPPPPRHRRKMLQGRASLVPTFVLSAILALVVAASIYFGRDPVPEIQKARPQHLAGKPSPPPRDDAGQGRP
jgi:hypothetical protein